MCHQWWDWRMYEEREREASRELWDEFERTQPLSDPGEEEVEVTLEAPEAQPASAKR